MKTLTLTVAQFNSFIKKIFDSEEFLWNIAIIGEVTNLKFSGDNAFFDLKDSEAMVSCIKFGASDFDVKNGDKITAVGRVNFYIKSGKLSFIIKSAEKMGQGDLYQQFLFLKNKLEKEGYFKLEIKKEIPKYAKRIGVVTSETGAVIRDIINVTKSKNPYTDIIVYPSKVQGVGAENELAKGIEYFNTRDDIDTIIVARGGGSIQDLAPFNTEKIVIAIYNSKKPVISAVGHETDYSLSDFASDLRVPTPSVAAQVAVFDYYETIRNIQNVNKQNYQAISELVLRKKRNLVTIGESSMDKLKLKLKDHSANLSSLIQNIDFNVNAIINDKQNKLQILTKIISKLNPLEILKSGYSVVESDNKKISSVSNLNVNDDIKVTLYDGYVRAKVVSFEKNNAGNKEN